MKKKDFLSDVMLFEMLKFAWSTAKILSLLLDDMCQLSTKHGYVNELPIKTVL